MTGYSTICIRAEYRTQMTIIPCCKTGGMGSDPNFSCSSSSQQSAPIFKSDHFAGENIELGCTPGGTGGAGGKYRLFFLRLIAQFFTQIYLNCFVIS